MATPTATSSVCQRSAGAVCRHHADTDRHVFVVCTGEHCAKNGASKLLQLLRLHRDKHEDQDVRISASRTCIGHCAAAPAMVEDGRVLRWVSLRRLKGELIRLGLA